MAERSPQDGRRWVAVSLWAACALVLIVIAAMTVGRVSRRPEPRTGDFLYYFDAATAVRIGENPYTYASATFPNPPLAAVVLSWLVPLGLRGAAYAWLPINLGLLAVSAWLSGKIVVKRLAMEDGGGERERAAGGPLLPAVVLGGLLLTIDQCRWTIVRGNVDTLLLLPTVAGLWWLDRRPAICGTALGFAANIKYLTLAMLPYLALRARWRAAAALAASTVGFALLPALVVGWERNLQLLRWALVGIARLSGVDVAEEGMANAGTIEERTRGISISAALGRLGHQMGLGPVGTVGLVAAAAGATGLIAWWIYARAGVPLFWGRWGKEPEARRPGVVLLEWCGVITAMLAFSPHTEVRHTVLLLPVHAATAALLLAERGVSRWPLAVALVLSQLAFRLPPGGATYETALDEWRSVGGPSVFMLVMYLALLWTGLEWTKRRAG